MRLTLGSAFCAVLALGQPPHEFLLKESREFSLRVENPQGQPLEDVVLAYAANGHSDPRTDKDGRVSIRTRAPAIVLRKPGYKSQFLKTTDPHSSITMSPQERILVQSEPCGPCETIEGFSARFCFPRLPGVAYERQRNDIDYGSRQYQIKVRRLKGAVYHGSGPLWGAGLPLQSHVWSSVSYAETSYETGKGEILDARGSTAAGLRWRSLGRFGETATYSHADDESARLLDVLLDGFCLR